MMAHLLLECLAGPGGRGGVRPEFCDLLGSAGALLSLEAELLPERSDRDAQLPALLIVQPG